MALNETQGGWLFDIVQFLAWIVGSVGAIISALYIREAVLAGLSVYQVIATDIYHKKGGVGINFTYGYAMTFIDYVMFIVLGCLALGATIYIEYFFRKGRPKGLLFKRMGLVFGIEAAIIVLSIVIRQII